jgi:DNA-binding GntR family transcriptional regulator
LWALDKLGIHAATIDQEASAVAADPLVARHLDLGVGAPTLNLRGLARDARGRIICFANYLYRPDRYEIHTVVEREKSQRGRQALRL